MRYIPMSQYSFEEICEQCRQAVLRAKSDNQNGKDNNNEILYFYPVKDYESLVR